MTKGRWTGGGSKINMSWTAGADSRLTFSGTFVASSPKQYVGNFGGIDNGLTGQLVKGAVETYDGFTC